MGQGISQEDVQAHRWFNVAASRNTGEFRATVIEDRDRADGELKPDGLNEAQRLAREWDVAHPREP